MKWLVVAGCLAIAACAGVLGLRHDEPQPFPHRKHTIAGVSCTRCHPDIEKTSAALHIPDDASCTTCHAKPHNTNSCLGCHSAPNAIGELVEAREHIVFDHGRHTKPSKGNCVRCHAGIADGDDHLRPAMATCYGCHQHEAARDARVCSTCHKNLEDGQTLPKSHLVHDGDWSREHGTRAASSGDVCQSCHRESFCAECHGKSVAALPATMRFGDPFAPSVHRAGFSARHSLEAKSEPGACASCHSPDRCATCHQSKGIAGEARRSPHPPGWVGPADNEHGREARRDPAQCASCHDGAGQALCVTCHKVGGIGGNPHPAGWSSRVAVTAMPCRLCHPIGSRP